MLLLLAAQLLQPGAIIDRPIKTGESHKYEVRMEQGQFLHCSSTQNNIDIAMLLNDPAGKTVTALNRLWWEGVEDLPWIAETAGVYVVSVDGKANNGPASYKFSCQVRNPSDTDTKRARAYHSGWREALHWNMQQDAESLRKAIAAYEVALPLWRELKEPGWEAWTLSQAAYIWEGFGDTKRAIAMWNESAALRRPLPEPYALSITLNNLGTTLNDIGENEKALEALEEALALRIAIRDRRGEGNVRGNLGLLYFRWNDYDKAIEHHRAALAIRLEVKDRSGEALTLLSLGNVYLARGELQRAIDHHIESLRIREEMKNLNGQGDAHGAIGIDYLTSGEYSRSAEHWQRAEALYTQTGSKLAVATARHNLGRVALATGDIQRAKTYFEESLAARRAGNARIGQTMTLAALCETTGEKHYAAEGLSIARAINSRASIAANLQCLARVEKNPQLLQEALQIFREIGSPDDQSRTLSMLAAIERDSGNLPKALAHIEQAALLAESVRGAVASSSLRATFRAARADRVNLHVEILMGLGQTTKAFEVAERGRARSLVELMTEARSTVRQDLTPQQSDREQRLIGAITAAQRLLFRPNLPETRRKQIEADLSAAEREFDLFQIELRREGNRYGASQYALVNDAKATQAQLPPRSALIEFALGDQKSYAWVVTSGGVQGVTLPGRQQIESRVEAFRRLAAKPVTGLTASRAVAALDTEAAALSRVLFAPLEPFLTQADSLIVVPDGSLAYLPLEVLPTAKGRVIERYRVAYAPSASTLSTLRERKRQPNAGSLFALADPAFPSTPAPMAERGFDFTRLPQTRAEVNAIQSLFRPGEARVFLGDQAVESSVKSLPMDSYRYLHFAAHGYFDEERPARSGIVLSPDPKDDGVLQAHEVMRLRLNADLVTLSACQTGLGRLLAGEGVVSLTRAFFYAGAQSVVVSLWNVNDAATAGLMKSFYTNLHKGLPREEALRQAKLAMLRNPRWRHPYFWAPFVFIGEPGLAGR